MHWIDFVKAGVKENKMIIVPFPNFIYNVRECKFVSKYPELHADTASNRIRSCLAYGKLTDEAVARINNAEHGIAIMETTDHYRFAFLDDALFEQQQANFKNPENTELDKVEGMMTFHHAQLLEDLTSESTRLRNMYASTITSQGRLPAYNIQEEMGLVEVFIRVLKHLKQAQLMMKSL